MKHLVTSFLLLLLTSSLSAQRPEGMIRNLKVCPLSNGELALITDLQFTSNRVNEVGQGYVRSSSQLHFSLSYCMGFSPSVKDLSDTLALGILPDGYYKMDVNLLAGLHIYNERCAPTQIDDAQIGFPSGALSRIPRALPGQLSYLCPGDSLLLKAGENCKGVRWENGQYSHQRLITEPGIYIATYPGSGFPPQRDTFVVEDCQLTGLENLVSDQLRVYPQPMKKQAWVEVPDNWVVPVTVELYDLQGRQQQLKQVQTTKFLLTRYNLPAGSYLLELRSAKGQNLRRKILITD